jgi:cytochrome b6-f complex iron-sulfur subunit
MTQGSSSVDRRRWLAYLLRTGIGASILSMLYPILNFILPPKTKVSGPDSVEVSKRPEEIKPNSGFVFPFGSQPAILIRIPEGELRAFSAVCTHLGCTVTYQPDSKVIWCPCHNGIYDLHGRNIAGPPPRPLPEYKVNVRGDTIIVTKPA